MFFKDIEFELNSASSDHIHLPIMELTDEMYAAVDEAMADRWYKLGGLEGIETGFGLEEIADIRAYLVPHIDKRLFGIGYRVEVFTEQAPQRILCKRFSTKSRISRYQCACWGLIPLVHISPGRLGRYARRKRRECRPNLPGILLQGDQPAFRSANMISS